MFASRGASGRKSLSMFDMILGLDKAPAPRSGSATTALSAPRTSPSGSHDGFVNLPPRQVGQVNRSSKSTPKPEQHLLTTPPPATSHGGDAIGSRSLIYLAAAAISAMRGQ